MKVVQAGQIHRTGQPGSGAGRYGCCALVLHRLGWFEQAIPYLKGMSNTLSKSVALGSPRFKRVRDLGCLSRVVCAGRLRT